MVLRSLPLMIFLVLCLQLFRPLAPVMAAADEVEYDLALSFQLESHLLKGTVRIILQPGGGLNLDLSGLSITAIILRQGDGQEESLSLPTGRHLQVTAENEQRELFLSYTLEAATSGNNLISSAGIALVDSWHPVPDRAMRFRLQARLPEGFSAISESDHFPLAMTGDTATATYSQPLQVLHFVAGPYAQDSLEVRQGLRVHSLFFQEDQNLSRSYLEAAKVFLERYEREIGPFPYAHYVIVANRLPTGLGMPTFTLMGQQVLRLPFIKETSLGHEILHSWFGNSVEVDPSRGNWAEGLTTFLADHAYRVDQGQAAADRKERIINYLSYTTDQSAIPLSTFRSADHRLPQASLIRATGYNRATLFFAELENLLGKEVFTRALRNFYSGYSNRSASWDDLEQIFSRAAGRDLSGFFAERLDRADIPELAVNTIEVNQQDGQTHLTFELEQKSELPFSLQIPVSVTTGSGVDRFLIVAAKKLTPVSLTTKGLPLQLSIDPDYTFMRKLATAELPPVWSRFLGADEKLVILESEAKRELFQPLLDSLADANSIIKIADELKTSELSGKALLFLGLGHPLSRSIFARPPHSAEGLTLDVRRNPLDSEQVAVLVSAENRGEVAAVAPRLSHYGKYSFLHFNKGRNTSQQITGAESGLQFSLEQFPSGAATANLNPFAAIIDQLDTARVIHVGETHTSMADHRLQLRIIEALHQRNPDLAIGMEMFPVTSQAALDRYILGQDRSNEPDFLKKSRYFQVWRYDYRLYREILNFAREKRIPVIGLNLEGEVVSNVFRTGSTESLPEKTRNALPVDRDLDMAGYADLLAVMHDMHAEAGHGKGSLGGFIQAQALWDETMAETLAKYLRQHPTRRMVVIAGSQHTRKDTGIPPRLQRRLPLQQATVMNIGSDLAPENLADMADYFFVAPPFDLPVAAMMGIVLEPGQENAGHFLRINGFSPESKADEAGLKEEDLLLEIDGLAVQEMDDVRIALLDARIGQKVRVGIERAGKNGKKKEKLQFSVELIRPAPERAHP